MSGEYDQMMGSYAVAHQRNVSEAFRSLDFLLGARSGDDESVPIANYDQQVSEARDTITREASKLMSGDVVFPENAFFLLTGVSRSPEEVIAEIDAKYQDGPLEPNAEDLHTWSVAKLVVAHTKH